MTRIFISHSHLDENIADLLIDFLTESIEIPKTEIRCTSDPNHGLDFSSSSISDQLKNDLSNAGALIVIATIDSLRSPWILFEVGSFWTTDKLVAPIIGPGLILENLPGPLKGYRSIRIEDDDVSYQLKEFIRQLEDKLNLKHNLGTRRSDKKLEAFIDEFRAWKSQLPDISQQKNIEYLLQKVEEIEKSSRQKKQELEQSLQYQISQLEQARSQTAKQIKEIEKLRRQIEAVTTAVPTINRRKFLKWACLGGAGLGIVVVARGIFKAPPIKDFSTIAIAEPKYIDPRKGAPKVLGLPLWTVEFETVTVDQKGRIVKRFNTQTKFFEEDLGNLINLEMVSIPGGEFLMGTEYGEIERLVEKFDWKYFRREKPQHEVTIQPFFMGKFQITQAQWKVIASRKDLKVKQDLEPDPSNFKGDDLPAETISWNDAVEFCQRLSKLTEKEYRLPTEAEWEYAARAGTTTAFHFGETITSNLANYGGSSTYANEPKGEYREKTTPVGNFAPNAFGLYDMHGNVWEWCKDDWHDNYKDAPRDGSAWVSENSNIKKVMRGGCWYVNPSSCRSAARYDFFPMFTYDPYIGFRVVCSVPRT